jgi:hypothetical protein
MLSELLKDKKFIKDVLETGLKHKIGTLYAEIFRLDNANQERNIEVFWRSGYSTSLVVHLIKMGKNDCIIAEFPGGKK